MEIIPHPVLRFADMQRQQLEALLGRYGLELTEVGKDTDIPGSFWGEEEAGLKGRQLLVRADTPVHSILHEACHFVCMDFARRKNLDTNAGGDYDEENAVCYLQILLSHELDGFGADRMMQDMDAWGYSFRLGSARAWFEQDAEDARRNLLAWGIIGPSGKPSFKLREESRAHD